MLEEPTQKCLDDHAMSPDERDNVKFIGDEECAYVMQRYREEDVENHWSSWGCRYSFSKVEVGDRRREALLDRARHRVEVSNESPGLITFRSRMALDDVQAGRIDFSPFTLKGGLPRPLCSVRDCHRLLTLSTSSFEYSSGGSHVGYQGTKTNGFPFTTL